ncbi:TetR/AcrR family transcriptional regulator [Psychromicrobium lacuslunae]|uniref:TetR/AcrR family transcriptional regulator n=1 Tax=Psychromicrobium lacuslunae TaxID=1618207 RepID=UPI00069773EA|nr:TetR/AcrR family transcriptional regulator [Psychromicrobium lacuslunae]
MPKIVDEGERRRSIAEHVLSLLSQSGTDAVTYSTVAAEAKVSRGMLQHYFASREELLDAAGQALHGRIDSRITQALASPTPTLRLQKVLCCLLPGDDSALRDVLAGRAILARSLADTEMRGQYILARTQFAELVEGLIEELVGQPPGRAALLANMLIGLLAECTEQLLLQQLSLVQAEALLDKAVSEFVTE